MVSLIKHPARYGRHLVTALATLINRCLPCCLPPFVQVLLNIAPLSPCLSVVEFSKQHRYIATAVVLLALPCVFPNWVTSEPYHSIIDQVSPAPSTPSPLLRPLVLLLDVPFHRFDSQPTGLFLESSPRWALVSVHSPLPAPPFATVTSHAVSPYWGFPPPFPPFLLTPWQARAFIPSCCSLGLTSSRWP